MCGSGKGEGRCYVRWAISDLDEVIHGHHGAFSSLVRDRELPLQGRHHLDSNQTCSLRSWLITAEGIRERMPLQVGTTPTRGAVLLGGVLDGLDVTPYRLRTALAIDVDELRKAGTDPFETLEPVPSRRDYWVGDSGIRGHNDMRIPLTQESP